MRARTKSATLAGQLFGGREPFGATRGSRAPTMPLSNRWRKRRDRLWRRRVLRDPLLARQFCGNLDDIAMALLSLDLGGGFSVDSVCHLRDRPALAFYRTFYELFSPSRRSTICSWSSGTRRLRHKPRRMRTRAKSATLAVQLFGGREPFGPDRPVKPRQPQRGRPRGRRSSLKPNVASGPRAAGSGMRCRFIVSAIVSAYDNLDRNPRSSLDQGA